MVETKIIIKGFKIIVLNKLRLPNKQNSGKLFKVLPLPMVVNSMFVTLNINETQFIANNAEGQFLEFSNDQLGLCKKTHDIFICNNQPWIDPQHPSCTFSLFHANDEDTINLCNFIKDKLSNSVPQVHIGPNKWPFSVKTETKAIISCTNEIAVVDNIEGNGVITIDQGCTVKLGSN